MPTTTLPDWLTHAMGALRTGDVDQYLSMYSEDAVHEFPFAPDERPGRLEGRAEIGAYMRQLPGMIEFDSLDVISARDTGNELIVEATARGTRLGEGGGAFRLDYVWFIRHANGQVTHFRDYMNPLQLRQI